MAYAKHVTHKLVILAFFVSFGIACSLLRASVFAQTQTQDGDISISATVMGAPPTTTPTMQAPVNNTVVTTTPLVVSGLCEYGFTIEVFNQGALAGTGDCNSDGTFTINIGLLIGTNVLTVWHIDSFGRTGPLSDGVTVFVEEAAAETSSESTPEEDEVTQAGITEEASAEPSSTFERLITNNVAPPVRFVVKVLGISGSSGPVSAPQQVAYAAGFTLVIGLISDITLFESSLSSAFLRKIRFFR